jgi:peptidoglycan/xylan/chitin deacetylase (PgdA/CDA1 family)
MRPIRRRFFPGAVVLGYHRVADDPWDPLGLQVSSQHFAEQLEVLQGLREVIRWRSSAGRRARASRSIAIAVLTFDDGYADFASTVVPVAASAGVPVTVFVASGCLDGGFWWEELAGLLAPGEQGMPVLELRVTGSETMSFAGLDQAAIRTEAVNTIGARLSCANPTIIESVLEQLRAWAGAAFDAETWSAAPMTTAALAEVARSSLVEIGAHTVSHCFLEGLDAERQRAEIVGSKAELERICGRAIEVFSYPNGSYSRGTPRIVRDLGFTGACASMEGNFTRSGDPFMIPRIWVPDMPGPDFRRWLGNWVMEAVA